MKPPRNLVLAHHGTPGALCAEALAFALAERGTTRIVHLFVIPDLWGGMQGDDWLNNASTRDAFADYLEGMLERDAAEQLLALETRCRAQGFDYLAERAYGDPAEILLAVAERHGADLVVIGPPRRKGEEGLRSRMELEPLVRRLRAPLVVATRG